MRILLDTNVVLDFILEREEHFENSEKIFQHLDNGDINVFVGTITPINVFYVTKKLKGKEVAWQAIRFLLDAVDFCVVDKVIFEDAFSLEFTDYEDAVQCASAVAAGLDVIVTRNAKDYIKSPIAVYSPIEFLELLQKQLVN